MKISVTIPVHPAYGDNMDAFRLLVLLQSLQVCSDRSSIDEINIVVPDKTVPVLKWLEDKGCDTVKINVIGEGSIFIEPERQSIASLGGWVRQQLLKLSSNGFCKNDAILMLDADCVSCGPVDIESLCNPGDTRIPIFYSHQISEWAQASADVMQTAVPDFSIGVTPCFISAQVLDKLQTELSSEKLSWFTHLANLSKGGSKWTEYTLYAATLHKFGLLGQIHQESKRPLYTGLWKNTELNDDLAKYIASYSPQFLVAQSIKDNYTAVQKFARIAGFCNFYDLPPNEVASLADKLDSHYVSGAHVKKHSESTRSLVRYLSKKNSLSQAVDAGSSEMVQQGIADLALSADDLGLGLFRQVLTSNDSDAAFTFLRELSFHPVASSRVFDLLIIYAISIGRDICALVAGLRATSRGFLSQKSHDILTSLLPSYEKYLLVAVKGEFK